MWIIHFLFECLLFKEKTMKISKLLSTLLAAALTLAASAASATVLTVYNDFDGGLANFNSTVVAAGGSATHDNWNNLPSGNNIVRTDYTLAQNDGSYMNPSVYSLYNSSPNRTTSGDVVSINPYGSSGIGAKESGVTLTFNAPINAIGFEVGDWATCCQPSDLYISFDNGAPILVAHSAVFGDGFLTNGGAGVFVAAFDDTGDFTTVQFWGDGIGEVLHFGGTIHYALLDQGSLPPLPEPATLALMGLGLLGVRFSRRNSKA